MHYGVQNKLTTMYYVDTLILINVICSLNLHLKIFNKIKINLGLIRITLLCLRNKTNKN